MINPSDITNFNRSTHDLEMFWIFSVCVAGKNSQVTAKKVQQMYDELVDVHLGLGVSGTPSPMGLIYQADYRCTFMPILEKIKIGQYNRIYKALVESAFKIVASPSSLQGIDLRSCHATELEKITGVGPKTARFFIMHTQKDVAMAALDTHILRWLRDLGYDAPKTTPSGDKYAYFETVFLKEASRRDMASADLDLHVWNHYSQNKTGVPLLL